jgi:predicted AlkP superfamily pyrophosphatase or phosphodiesterase
MANDTQQDSNMKTIIAAALFLISTFGFCGGYQTVILVSVDALHPNALSVENSHNIMSLAEKGFYSPNGKSTTPPKTLIAHTAMLTGLSPQENGKTDNNWEKGAQRVQKPTIMTTAKRMGYETNMIYSKQKLGYLRDVAVDNEIFSAEDATEKAADLLDTSKKQFIFLHVSGLDTEGPISGWLSPEYLDEFRFIDEQLGALFMKANKSSSALIIVTSDHAGHEKIHGSDHPEDFKRPLVIYSSKKRILSIPDAALRIDGLKSYIEGGL